MLKRLFWVLLGIVISAPLILGIAGVKAKQIQAMIDDGAKQVVPPETVNSFQIRAETWHPKIPAVGTVAAIQGTDISAEVEGVVREVMFEAGSDVTSGALLLQLDTDVEKAQLREAEAAAELARLSFSRARELIVSRSIAQAEYDSASITLKQAMAQVDNIKATIARKAVRAPFSGKLGIRYISVGEFLQKGDRIVSLQALDPVYVDFSVPQQRLGEIHEGLTVAVTSDAYPENRFEGIITAINPAIDEATRNLRVQATLPNPDERLRPGMFVTVDVMASRTEDVLLIPATAVQHAPYGDSVYIIEDGPKEDPTTTSLVVKQQIVRLGTAQGDFVVVRSGLKAGDIVVSTGVFKLRPGLAVVIDNSLAPEFKLNPTPADT